MAPVKLTIGSKTPSWWIEDSPNTISEWWDGLEWQSVEPPEKCAIVDAVCYSDKAAHMTADTLHLEWLYKIGKNTREQIISGVESEVINLAKAFVIWAQNGVIG